MKKLILLLAIATCVTAASAQSLRNREDSRPNFRYGVTGGLNVTGVSNVDNDKAKVSFFAGAFAEFRLGYVVSIQPEVIYSRQGFKTDYNSIDSWHRLNYLNIPVLVKLYLFERLSLDLGPQFGILLNSKTRSKIDGSTVKSDIDGIKGGDISFAMGLTYRFYNGVFINTRYNLGLTDNLKNNSGDNFSNRVWQLGVGYAF